MDRQIQLKIDSAKEYGRNPHRNYCLLIVGSAETEETPLEPKSSWIYRLQPNSLNSNYCSKGEKPGYSSCSFELCTSNLTHANVTPQGGYLKFLLICYTTSSAARVKMIYIFDYVPWF